MSQKGGTYRPAQANPPARERRSMSSSTRDGKDDNSNESTIAKKKTTTDVVASQSESPAQSRGQKDNDGEGQDWAVVDGPTDEPDTPGGGVSSHFSFQVGWGSWRTTLFSWDLNVKKGNSHNNPGS